MTHDPREVPQITMADIRKHTGEGMVSEQSVIDAANEVLKEIYTSPPPAAGWNEAIEAAKLVVERWSLPTIQTPSMWLIDKAGIVAEIESLRREAPVPKGVAKDLADISTGQLFNVLLSRINFDGMDPRTFSLAELKNAIDGAEWPR